MTKFAAALKGQMLAALSTLHQCIETCPREEWDQSHGDAPFSQVVFHTLFYIDYYLSIDEDEFKAQPFHAENKAMFRDYEEMEYKKAENLYTKDEIDRYFAFCHEKIEKLFNNALAVKADVEQQCQDMSAVELIIYVTRHIQHHAAQLGLRVQQITGGELKWVRSGWRV
jgi:hypothetical protein